jgi:hypothetical protein
MKELPDISWLTILRNAANDLDAERAKVAKLREALTNCADDLEAQVNAQWRMNGTIHPANLRRYNRDMGPIIAARSALDETK